ncbi:MAG TPA: MFS transporter [Candidatus Saccharimonadales bacterium]|jgi:FHS family glucose/mannose:H+ symporter-like MFS transporter|nr:MFS transporter [Candidatus Saccharimonadales bacterium]
MSTTTSIAIPEPTSSSRTGLLTVLFLGFVLSGIATTIVGPMLPVFIRRWGLDDGQAGLFSSVQFLAALVGTVISGAWMAWRGYRPSLVTGYALIGYGLATLNASTHVNALAATAAFGLGYGLITAATNLYVAEAGGVRSASLLSLLNFTWGAGAMACSPLIALALRRNRLPGLLITYAIFGAGLAIALLFARFGGEKHEQTLKSGGTARPLVAHGVTIALAALFFAYVCMETSIGVWSAEYSRRIANGITNVTTLAPMFFYAGLTAGRGLAPLALLSVAERPLVLGALSLTAMGTTLLIFSTTLKVAILGVFLAGLGCASIYPIYIAWLSKWYRAQAKHIGGFLFALASLGGSAGPWLVGVFSKYSGSLRVGFLVPLFSALLMICIVASLRRQTSQ